MGNQGPIYSFDDDPRPWGWPKASGEMLDARFSQTTAAERIRRETRKPKGSRTAGQQRRERRDLVILLCHDVGLSSRVIADVFAMSRARVGEIIEEQQVIHGI